MRVIQKVGGAKRYAMDNETVKYSRTVTLWQDFTRGQRSSAVSAKG